MTEWDRYLCDATDTIVRNHGADAETFAAERLAFCTKCAFVEGIALWQGIVDQLSERAARSPDQNPTRH